MWSRSEHYNGDISVPPVRPDHPGRGAVWNWIYYRAGSGQGERELINDQWSMIVVISYWLTVTSRTSRPQPQSSHLTLLVEWLHWLGFHWPIILIMKLTWEIQPDGWCDGFNQFHFIIHLFSAQVASRNWDWLHAQDPWQSYDKSHHSTVGQRDSHYKYFASPRRNRPGVSVFLESNTTNTVVVSVWGLQCDIVMMPGWSFGLCECSQRSEVFTVW